MSELLVGVVVGAVGSLVAMVIGYYLGVGRNWAARFFKVPFRLARKLHEGGVTRFTLSRKDYIVREGAGPLRSYLATAKHSIEIVSISMNVTQKEGSLISLFEQRINENTVFRVRMTLLNPDSPVIPPLAKSLDLQPVDLRREILDTLKELWRCKLRLPLDRRNRLTIMIHDTLPIGSAILLDTTPEQGRIQLETKLYRAPRTDSFGFEIVGPTEFYKRSYEAWQKVFDDSTDYEMGRLTSGEVPLLDHIEAKAEPLAPPKTA